jgi:hypothetical protein
VWQAAVAGGFAALAIRLPFTPLEYGDLAVVALGALAAGFLLRQSIALVIPAAVLVVHLSLALAGKTESLSSDPFIAIVLLEFMAGEVLCVWLGERLAQGLLGRPW